MLSAFLLCGCYTTEYNTAAHSQNVFFYSTDREVAMGQNIARKISEEFKLSANSNDIERVNAAAEKITKFIDRQEINYYFYIIEKDQEGKSQINAFSVPGGYIYIFKELLDLLDEEELAFVLAHEAGHIASRHQIKRLQAAMGYNLLMAASTTVDAGPEFSRGLSFALVQLLSAYSREDEFNADGQAVRYCKAAGFDPKAGIEVLEKLYKEGKKKIRPISYFRTHPYTAQRIRQIKEILHLPLDVEDYIN
ncbi:MAG: M48 family metalloprotease [Candidatus Omnitrophota bacterium]